MISKIFKATVDEALCMEIRVDNLEALQGDS